MQFFTWDLFDYDIFIGKARVVSDPERTKKYNETQKRKQSKTTKNELQNKNLERTKRAS